MCSNISRIYYTNDNTLKCIKNAILGIFYKKNIFSFYYYYYYLSITFFVRLKKEIETEVGKKYT